MLFLFAVDHFEPSVSVMAVQSLTLRFLRICTEMKMTRRKTLRVAVRRRYVASSPKSQCPGIIGEVGNGETTVLSATRQTLNQNRQE